MKKIHKYAEWLFTKIKVNFSERVFIYKDTKIRYIFQRNNSKYLIVIFSACTRKGIKARYNYMGTLKRYKVNKLFILDDMGFDNRGIYYLGKNKDFKVKEGVNQLIDKIIKLTNSQTNIFLGSSKGGYAALMFGIERKKSHIIVGAPQYYLGNYLNNEANGHILDFIMGDRAKDSVDTLNEILKNTINSNKTNSNKIYINCSKNEPTYDKHVKSLISELEADNIDYEVKLDDYSNHLDIGSYFPSFIHEIIKKIIKV